MQAQPVVTEKSRVLVVDDESQITRVLRTVLTSQGYQVRTAAEGEAALTDFKEWNPELVITDLYMPHMNGVELCRRIRALSAAGYHAVTRSVRERAVSTSSNVVWPTGFGPGFSYALGWEPPAASSSSEWSRCARWPSPPACEP